MVAKLKKKREFALFQTSSILFSFIQFVKCWRNFLELNLKEQYRSLGKEKENFCVVFTYSIEQAREIEVMLHETIRNDDF